MHTTFNNNSNNNDFIATYINRWTWPMYSVCKLDHATVDPFTVNYTCASHFFTSENALQNKNVPLIASLSLSLFKSCPESGEEHAYAQARTHYELLRNLNRSKIHSFPHISLSHSIFFSSDRAEKRNCESLPIDWPREHLRKETSRRDLGGV